MRDLKLEGRKVEGGDLSQKDAEKSVVAPPVSWRRKRYG